uniref:Chaperone protein dnaJ 1, mitochondrial n=1 Tax=Anthurium amnicola TaxID=1678845 RepID=A0A1D1YID0_9ARAE
MVRFGSTPSGLFCSRSRSRLLSLARTCPPSLITRPSVGDGNRRGGFLQLFRAISQLRLPPVHMSSRQEIEMPSFLLTNSVPLLKRFFHATGLCSVIERDYYETLGIPKNASQDDIKKAFHALAKKYHPDANKNNPTAKRKFQEIREAYEILRDSDERAQYDQELSGGTKQGTYTAHDSSGFDNYNQDPFSETFYNIFSEIFQDERETFATDIEVELLLSFTEAAKGCTKRLNFSAHVPCDSCKGSGHPTNAKPKVCTTCGGTGRVTVIPFTSRCSACKGFGRIIKDHCVSCGGSGVVKNMKNVDVSIPAGVNSGDIIRVPKAGNSGRRGVHTGNLLIKLKVAKDPIFSRDGADIYVDSNISFTQAILGGNVEVPTLFGKAEVKIPKGVQPGQQLVLRGRGLPKRFSFVDHGDQYVRFRIHFPSSVNERQKSLLEEFAKEEEILERSIYVEGNRLYEQLSTG